MPDATQDELIAHVERHPELWGDYGLPAPSTCKAYISAIDAESATQPWLDKPWTPSTAHEYADNAVDAHFDAVLAVWRRATVWSRPFTRRRAKWVARLSSLAPKKHSAGARVRWLWMWSGRYLRVEKLNEAIATDSESSIALDGELAFAGAEDSTRFPHVWHLARRSGVLPVAPEFPIYRHAGAFPDADDNSAWYVDRLDGLIITSFDSEDIANPVDYEGVYLALKLVSDSPFWVELNLDEKRVRVRTLLAAFTEQSDRELDTWMNEFLADGWDREVEDADYS